MECYIITSFSAMNIHLCVNETLMIMDWMRQTGRRGGWVENEWRERGEEMDHSERMGRDRERDRERNKTPCQHFCHSIYDQDNTPLVTITTVFPNESHGIYLISPQVYVKVNVKAYGRVQG